MKKTLTLTKVLTLAVLLVTFTTASASFGGDGKCKTKCCKDKKQKEIVVAMAELEKAMNKMEAALETLTAFAVNTEVKQTLQNVRLFVRPTMTIAYAPAVETTTVESKYRINFSDINAEMDKVQEKMTTAPDMSQKIDFSNLSKEMNDTQEKMTLLETSNG